MVRMQMSDENLVEEIVRYLESRNTFSRSCADIKKKFVAITQFNEEAGGRLGRARGGHSCTAGDDAHFMGAQVLGVRIVGIPLPRLGGRNQQFVRLGNRSAFRCRTDHAVE